MTKEKEKKKTKKKALLFIFCTKLVKKDIFSIFGFIRTTSPPLALLLSK